MCPKATVWQQDTVEEVCLNRAAQKVSMCVDLNKNDVELERSIEQQLWKGLMRLNFWLSALLNLQVMHEFRIHYDFGGYLKSDKSYMNSGRYGQKLHSDRAQKGTTGNMALLVPNPVPLPLVSHHFACLFPLTKIMIAFSHWAMEDWYRHLFTMLTEYGLHVCSHTTAKLDIQLLVMQAISLKNMAADKIVHIK